MSTKVKPCTRSADSHTITCKRFCELAGISHETYRRWSRKGLVPRQLPAGISRAEALQWLQARADEAAQAASSLRPSVPSEPSTEAGA